MEPSPKQEVTPPVDGLESTESPPHSATYARAACTECARRKQRCNREWPCNHCKKRKVGNQCRYNHDSLIAAPRVSSAGPSQDVKRKRDRSEEDADSGSDPAEESVDYGGEGFEALGYSTAHLFAGLTTRDETTIRKPTSKQYFKDAASCPQLARALQALPPRPHTDSLVQNFLNNVNFHYYIIYPPNFLEEYQAWWKDRIARKPLGLQWTCLLIMICACSCQYTDVELEKRLEEDLSESVQTLTERYHNAARELHSVIPVGHNHLLNVQQLLHSCYWYKSEVRFVECWHVLGAAIREAQELGIHQESIAGPIPEFEREMRRRVWCILDTWDWQVSTLLGRPMIIDRSDCDTGPPSLSLEDFDPSPLLHMKLQSQLIGKMARTFGLPKYVVAAVDVQKYQQMIETWMGGFPKCYDIDEPDRSRDAAQPWMKLHRHYLHTMGHSMVLDPIRAFLAKDMSRQSTPEELQIRQDGIDYSLKLMKVLYRFFDYVYPRDSRFHFIIFCIFDTASVLCSTIIHDQDDSAQRKDDMLDAIDGAITMLKQIADLTPNAKTSHRILSHIAGRAKMAAGRPALPGPSKKTKITGLDSIHLTASHVSKTKAVPEKAIPPQHVPHTEYRSEQAQAQAADGNTLNYQDFLRTHPIPQIGFHAANIHQPVDYTIPPQFSVQDFLPQASFAPQAPAMYALDHMAGMQPHGTLNGHTTPGFFGDGSIDVSGSQQPGNVPALDFSAMTEEEMGQFSAVWQYRALNLDFINPESQGQDGAHGHNWS